MNEKPVYKKVSTAEAQVDLIRLVCAKGPQSANY